MNISKIIKDTKEKEEKEKVLEESCMKKADQFIKTRHKNLCNLFAENLSCEDNILKAYHDEENGKITIFYRQQIMWCIIMQLMIDIFGATNEAKLFHNKVDDIIIEWDSKSLTITPKGSYSKMSCDTLMTTIIDLFKNKSSDLLWRNF